MAKEKGTSSWLIALPIEKLGFSLHKSAFRDALCLRYGWQPSILPTTCVCGHPISIDHALNCHMGGFPTICRNEIRDLAATLMSEICHDDCTEPPLQPLSGESLSFSTANREDSARLDVRARGFWGLPQQDAYFDVCVFNPNSPSYRGLELTTCYRRQERGKQRAYEQRVREVEHGSFTPLVFNTAGGMGYAATTAYKREQSYSTVMGWMRCRLSFSLLRSAIMCLRGSQSKNGFVPTYQPDSIDTTVHEARNPRVHETFFLFLSFFFFFKKN